MAWLVGSSSYPKFQYASLNSKPRTFRAIQLLPSAPPRFPDFHERLRVKIVEVSVDDVGSYDALSYVWGNVGRRPASRLVIVETPEGGEAELRIYASLEVALLSLVRQSHARPLFVDQICINQRDEAEKKAQVQLMGEIYARCARVVIWLGPGTRESDRFFGFTGELCEDGVLNRVMGPNVARFPLVFKAVMDPSVEVDEVERRDRDDILSLLAKYGPGYPLRGLADVLEHPWFNRLWIIQEICLAPEVVFMCGEHALCIDCFRVGIMFFNIWNTYWVNQTEWSASEAEIRLRNGILDRNASFIRLFQERKSLYVTRERRSLYDLVLKYNVNEHDVKIGATEPEDRIFGLLGLAQDGLIRDEIASEIKYKNVREVYTRFAALVIKEDIDVLLLSQAPKSKHNLPSWVPDWSASKLRLPHSYSKLRTPSFSAGGTRPTQEPSVDLRTASLLVPGIIVDRISRAGTQSMQEEKRPTDIQQLDYVSARRFIDEIHEFLSIAENLRHPGIPATQDEQQRTQAVLRLSDGGLSERQFPSPSSDPDADSSPSLHYIHTQVSRWGQRLIDTERNLLPFYSLRHILKTATTGPWYTAPYRILQSLLGALHVQLYVLYSRLRRRHTTTVLRSAYPEDWYRAAGLDPAVWRTPESALVSENMCKNAGRRLFVTEQGYVGLGPGYVEVEAGDVVVVLLGSSVPHVLRPKVDDAPAASVAVAGGGGGSGTADADADAEAWTYLGEAYCEGIMDGEILREGGRSHTNFRVF
ncbi:heterokaryon incompatibility protein [Whalleya microplaca]|nr:heterokaryon incompatibility protein [Whalleya microplaca]